MWFYNCLLPSTVHTTFWYLGEYKTKLTPKLKKWYTINPCFQNGTHLSQEVFYTFIFRTTRSMIFDFCHPVICRTKKLKDVTDLYWWHWSLVCDCSQVGQGLLLLNICIKSVFKMHCYFVKVTRAPQSGFHIQNLIYSNMETPTGRGRLTFVF